MQELTTIIEKIKQGDFRSIAQCITLVENDLPPCEELLKSISPNKNTKTIGITGPPGAGKSTLINAILRNLVTQQKRVAVLSIDPSSPFNYGALLGDRIRMSEFYLNPLVYIRSLASRGSLGGLNAKIIEIIEVVRAANFDFILIETVGVGQSEVEIAGLADTTLVVVVPEAGDEVQTMKAGVMEIADIFIVNKADRDNADEFVRNLKYLAHSRANEWEAPVLKCVANQHIGIEEIISAIEKHFKFTSLNATHKSYLLTEKAYQLIQQHRMKDINKSILANEINNMLNQGKFQLFKFIEAYMNTR